MQPCEQTNIMDEILCGREEYSSVSALGEASQLLYLFTKPAKKKAVKKESPPVPGTKKKRTHYLAPRTNEELETFRRQLLFLFPEIKKNTFSRSNIVEKALQLIMKRFQDGQDKGELLKILIDAKKT